VPQLVVSIDPPRIVEGHTGVVWVDSTLPVTLTGVLDDRQLTFVRDGRAGSENPLHSYWAVFGMPAMSAPGQRAITLTAVDELGRTVGASGAFEVVAGSYPTEAITLAPDRLALLDPKLLQAEREKVESVFTAVTPRQLWDGLFTRPVTSEISSGFGIRRSYNGGPANSFHEGNDFRGPAGLPVVAPAAGLVALAEPLTVRGNAVVLDHGLGVFTGYWHLSEIDVRPGDRVEPGQVIGRVGHTGLSTGAHLHWEMRIGNIYVDVLEWTERALPGGG
jgi:murein DD-endopeptidase MepM/ murein hydrolase activator NlpD